MLMELAEEKAKPFEKLTGANGLRLDLADYMKKHVYMFSSGDTSVKFRITKPMISDVIDMFGMDVRFCDETEDTVCVVAQVNEASMIQFAKSYAPDVEILEPITLRDKVWEEIKRGVMLYEQQ